MGRKKKHKKKQKSGASASKAVAQDAPGKGSQSGPQPAIAAQKSILPSKEPPTSTVGDTSGGGKKSRRSRFASPALALLVAILVPVVWFVFLREARGPSARLNASVSDNLAYEDFAGAETCEECHETQYEAWLTSTHGKAGGNPTTDLIIARFDGTPIRFADAVVTAHRRA